MASVFKGDITIFMLGFFKQSAGFFKLLGTEHSLKILSFKELCFSTPWVPDAHVYTLGAGWPTVTCWVSAHRKLKLGVQFPE